MREFDFYATLSDNLAVSGLEKSGSSISQFCIGNKGMKICFWHMIRSLAL